MAAIAAQQAAISRDKLRFDHFERRYSIYKAAQSALVKCIQLDPEDRRFNIVQLGL